MVFCWLYNDMRIKWLLYYGQLRIRNTIYQSMPLTHTLFALLLNNQPGAFCIGLVVYENKYVCGWKYNQQAVFCVL